LFFPKSDFSPWLAIPFGGDLLVSFIVPVLVSITIVFGWNAYATNTGQVKYFDFNQLRTRIRAYTGIGG
jgi:hypothetical protein